MVHNTAIRLRKEGIGGYGNKVSGVALLHSYFWGTEPVGGEFSDTAFYYPGDMERVWDVACGGEFGRDHPYINPAVSPQEWCHLGSGRVLVTMAELCWFVERARVYAEGIKACGWAGELEFYETRGKKHTYFLFRPDCDDAAKELAVVADFVRHC
uniref:Alpha/beta hydrolase fold-3 domain-containing protein n=2 Tax=Triticum urartu TaxID=4572 RepID=A0A8R7TKZ9_TRIUA